MLIDCNDTNIYYFYYSSTVHGRGNFRFLLVLNEDNSELYVGTKDDENSHFLTLDMETGKANWVYPMGKYIYF